MRKHAAGNQVLSQYHEFETSFQICHLRTGQRRTFGCSAQNDPAGP